MVTLLCSLVLMWGCRNSSRVPLTPKEGWLSDGRQVLRFRPTRW